MTNPFSSFLESQVLVAAGDEGLDLAVGDAALEHPEAAVGVHPADATGADLLFHGLDARRDLVGGLDVVHLDVDHADAEEDFFVDVLERIDVALRAVGEFEHEMVAMQRVEEIDEFLPVALLDGLAAVVAAAEMHGALALA